jgi:RNA methyltransferase, TrmH family
MPLRIESPANERIKRALRLRDRATRDTEQRVLIEGFREVRRALEGGWKPEALFYCRPLFLGHHEDELIERCRALGADLLDCGETAFRKLSYRDRPDGLIAVAPQQRRTLDDLALPPDPLLLVVEGVEKPGNLGTLLRTADAGGVDAVIVCDARTDLFNPNTVRSSVGALFLLPVAEATTAGAMAWLRARGADARRHALRHPGALGLQSRPGRRARRGLGAVRAERGLDGGRGRAGADSDVRPLRLAQRRRRRDGAHFRGRPPAPRRRCSAAAVIQGQTLKIHFRVGKVYFQGLTLMAL